MLPRSHIERHCAAKVPVIGGMYVAGETGGAAVTVDESTGENVAGVGSPRDSGANTSITAGEYARISASSSSR